MFEVFTIPFQQISFFHIYLKMNTKSISFHFQPNLSFHKEPVDITIQNFLIVERLYRTHW